MFGRSKLRQGGGCLSPFYGLGRGGSGIPGHSSFGAPGAGGTTPLLCFLMDTQRSESPHRLRRMAICPWDKDIPDPSRAPGQVASGVRSCEPPFIPFQAGARFPSPAALPDGGQEPAGRADVRDVAALPARPPGGGGARHSRGSILPHAPHCQLLGSGWA